MTITARYASTCTTCGQAITPGQQIEWSKGSRPRHTACQATTTMTTAARHRIQSHGHTAARRGNDGRRVDCRRYGWDGVVGSSSYYTSGQYDEDS